MEGAENRAQNGTTQRDGDIKRLVVLKDRHVGRSDLSGVNGMDTWQRGDSWSLGGHTD